MRTEWSFFGSEDSLWWKGGCLVGAVQVSQAGAFVCVKGREQKTLYRRQGVKLNFGFPLQAHFGVPFSVSLSKKSCGGAGVISELSLTLPQCFTSHSPPQSAQGPGLMMLLFVLVWFLISGVRGRGACVVETLLLGST